MRKAIAAVWTNVKSLSAHALKSSSREISHTNVIITTLYSEILTSVSSLDLRELGLIIFHVFTKWMSAQRPVQTAHFHRK